MSNAENWRAELRDECWKRKYQGVVLTVYYCDRANSYEGHAYLNDRNHVSGHSVGTFSEAARIAIALAERMLAVQP